MQRKRALRDGEQTGRDRLRLIRDIVSRAHTLDPKAIAEIIESPIVPPEIIAFLLRRKRLTQDQIRVVASTKRLMKDYHVKVELVICPLTPKHIALTYVKDLYYQDLAMVARNTGIPLPVREVAENFLMVRLESLRIGEKISLARIAIGAALGFLLRDSDHRILEAALNNPRLTEMDLIKFISDARTVSEKLDRICSSERWSSVPAILHALSLNPRLGYASRRRVYEKLPLNHLVRLIRSPQFTQNDHRLARFVFRQRVQALSEAHQTAMAQTHSRMLIEELVEILNTPRAVETLIANPKLLPDDLTRMRQRNRSEVCQRILQKRSDQLPETHDGPS